LCIRVSGHCGHAFAAAEARDKQPKKKPRRRGSGRSKYLSPQKLQQGQDVWEKPNGDRFIVKSGAEPIVPVKPIQPLTEPTPISSRSITDQFSAVNIAPST
jgi:hypothetical protein